ncbi:MAG: sodium:calcium antiporter [Bacteroidetes bacterium QH_9_64_21]|nr:MAG: sodium:calcium antiporter [Bacteroidetes bacterium QH_9_64_21]
MTTLLYALLAILATAVVWKGSGWLESSSERLSVYYELPPIIQGAIIVAVGSSFPELTTAVFSTLIHGEFELGVAAIVGSALFNVLMVPALASLWSEDALASNRDLVYKEAQFYLISIAVLLLVFSFAVIYNPVEGVAGSLAGEMTRTLALFPMAMYGLYIFVQYQDTMDHEPEVSTTDIRPGREWTVLVGALVAILVGVEGLVRAAVRFGELFGTPSFLWGITVVAAGTSVPDAFVSIRAARNGSAITSIANVLGSNIFDLLVCIPAGVLVAGTVTINYSVGAPMMAVLTVATLIVFLMMRTDLLVSRREAWSLVVIYSLFIFWMGVETFGVIDLIPSLPPST